MIFLLILQVSAIDCDLSLDKGFCIYSGTNIIKPYPILTGLQGYWTFDDDMCLDYSGSNNHGLKAVEAGHSSGGRGSSSYFKGSSYIEIPSTTSISSDVFSITFWIYLEEEDTINKTGFRWCPLLQKGNDDEEAGTFERTPAILFDRHDRAIRVYITTTENTDFPEGEYLESNSRLPYQRWHHITVIRSTQKTKLYINGIFDTVNSTEGWTKSNTSPLYLGNTPAKVSGCPISFLMDELRYYNRELKEDEIFSESYGALGQIESRFILLGCAQCNLNDASNACDSGYHLCTSIELHSGGYDVVRAMGWDQLSPTVWSYSALDTTYDDSVLGLGVCCLDLGY